ncbi:MAG: D-aminoacylase [Proteobacteria bacterium]|nr:D-aminoacylase [Pseudomonadota bacterium]
MYDVLIINGNIVDGTGRNSYFSDLGIKDGKIAAIGDLSSSSSEKTIDATGLVVAPGFIDIHTHSDMSLLLDPRAESQIRQGVTTEVIGQCGVSLAPRTGESRKPISGGTGHRDLGAWCSYAELLEAMDRAGIATNVVGMVGHGALRNVIMGPNEPRPATDEEVADMVSLLEKSLEEGAFGLSTGLEYHPGKMAGFDELAALCRAVARAGGYYATHSRNRDKRYFVGFGEALDLARETGVRLQISHINPKYGRPEHAMRNTIQMIEWAREEGIDVAMDMMPTNWNHSSTVAMLPAWSFALSNEAFTDLLKTPEGRERLKVNPLPMWQLVVEEKWDKIRLLSTSVNSRYLSWTIEEIAQERNTDGWDALFDLLLEEGNKARGVMLTSEAFSEEDNRRVLASPLCAVASDTSALAKDGILKGKRGTVLGYNWVARFLGYYLRDEKVLNLEEGIRRLTSLPASRIGLTDRGRLIPGAAADIAVFDLNKVKDNSSIADPNIYAGGFEHVMVNGVLAFSQGIRTPDHAGMVLRRN